MRIKNYRPGTLQQISKEYNNILKRKKTRTQLILKIVFIIGLLAFFSGVVSGLTGLNSGSTVVSAQERVNEFNPVKKKNKVVIVIIIDEENAKELLKKLGVHNETKVTE